MCEGDHASHLTCFRGKGMKARVGRITKRRVGKSQRFGLGR
nr:MAG TPA: hypothetical protein [Caudoviricetes sp.]